MLTFSLLIVFATEIIPPDDRDFHQRLDIRGHRVQLRAFDVVPKDGSFQQPPALLLGDEEYFRIETEPVNPLQPEDRLRGLSSERFEPALCVFEPQAGERELNQIAGPPEDFTKTRLTRSDQTSIERARSEDDVVTALGYGRHHFNDFAGRGRQIGVEKENDLALGFEHSVPHGIAFTPIPGILDQSQPAASSTLEFANLIDSMVC